MILGSGLLLHSGKIDLELCLFNRWCFKPAGSGHPSVLLSTMKMTAGSHSDKVSLGPHQGQRRERLVRKKVQNPSVVNIYLVRDFLFL